MPGACFPRPQVFPGPPDGAMQKFIISSKFCPDLHWPSMKLRKFWKKKRHRKHKPPKIKPQSQPHPHQTPAPPAPEAAHTQPHRRRPHKTKLVINRSHKPRTTPSNATTDKDMIPENMPENPEVDDSMYSNTEQINQNFRISF